MPHAFEFWIQRVEMRAGWQDLWRKYIVCGPRERWSGIYVIQGDTLTVCMVANFGGGQPLAGILTRPGEDDRYLLTLKRVKRNWFVNLLLGK
jgi:hypothetical protein